MSYYRNEYLFSEIYLEEITREPEQADILASLSVLQEYRDYADTRRLTAWKESYVHEVLAALRFSVKPSGALSMLHPLGSTDHPVSLCYIVLPDENLDNTSLGRNWAEKAIRALREHHLQWGLLTNGKQWRVYHLDEPTPYETYLEIDLDSILTDKAKEAYQIFFKLMKAENFAVHADGKRQFDRFKKESQDKIDYIEKELANALKQREEGGKGVLSDICMGYVDVLRARGENGLEDENLRRKIYHGAMLYMFRLLFLFYADARGLLSDGNHALLQAVEQECLARHNGESPDSAGRSLWERLEDIFVDIDQTYNGGLFSPQESVFTQFIEDTSIKDEYLASPVFNLTTYREKDGKNHPISYRDMSVRHLGTLYEGLLEHKLFIAKEAMEVRVTKGNIQFIPSSRGGKMITGHYVPVGRVYFGSDPTERKATGSYYTPEYIVDYIVLKTVGAKLREIKQAFLAREQVNLDAYNHAIDAAEKQSIAELLEQNALEFVRQQVLPLSVLDPAMGSGHFLVNATNLISNFVTELLNTFGIEGATPSGTAYWRRWVVENCIYGVDLNPLAVELGKLSLWILSMSKDQPLSFVNHHLKRGDSLVGARLEEVGSYPFSTAKKEPRQLAMFERDPDFKAAVEKAVGKSRLIGAKGSISLEDVEEKKTWLVEMEQTLAGYRAICDIHTGLYFGNSIDESRYATLVEKKDLAQAIALNKPNQYVHWELAFPEVMLSRGGFSCIVCNPPYDTFRGIPFFNRGVAAGTGNLYGHFIAKAVEINQTNGNIGFVVPLSFACGSSFESLRREIYHRYKLLGASHYSLRPNMLFDGVQQRITIFYALTKTLTTTCQLYSSKLWRWKKSDQEFVVRNPNLALVGAIQQGVIPKIHTRVGADIYNHLVGAPQALSSLVGKSADSKPHLAYYHSVARYWIKAYDFIPHFQREYDSSPSVSTKLKTVNLASELDKYIFLLLMNSSLFYYWWIANSDEFDVQLGEIMGFGLYGYNAFKARGSEVIALVKSLMEDYSRHSVIRTTSLGGSRAEYQEFYPRKSVEIIHRIDDFICPIYGLSDEQNEFLKSFDLSWRTDEE